MNIGDSPRVSVRRRRGRSKASVRSPQLTKMNRFKSRPFRELPRGRRLESAPRPGYKPARNPQESPMRKAEVSRTTAETGSAVKLDLDGTGRHDNRDRRRLLRPHARPARPPRADRPRGPRHGRPAHRRPPHRRGRRHRARPRARAGARRQARHPPLRRLPAADGRGAGPRRARPLGAAVPRLERRLPQRRRSAASTPSWSASSSPRWR